MACLKTDNRILDLELERTVICGTVNRPQYQSAVVMIVAIACTIKCGRGHVLYLILTKSYQVAVILISVLLLYR